MSIAKKNRYDKTPKQKYKRVISDKGSAVSAAVITFVFKPIPTITTTIRTILIVIEYYHKVSFLFFHCLITYPIMGKKKREY